MTDEAGQALPGALLSLSGGQYRSNKVTEKDGAMNFLGLVRILSSLLPIKMLEEKNRKKRNGHITQWSFATHRDVNLFAKLSAHNKCIQLVLHVMRLIPELRKEGGIFYDFRVPGNTSCVP